LLKQRNVLCVGGSWMCPAGLIAANDWQAIGQLAAQAGAAAKP
jgi:2-dehydro-3-deoxyphosphogluconate aldolase/(4S)-4-hydroxy-2-oxoglutarate aldolase